MKTTIYVTVKPNHSIINLQNKVAITVNTTDNINLIAKDFAQEIATENGLKLSDVIYQIYLEA